MFIKNKLRIGVVIISLSLLLILLVACKGKPVGKETSRRSVPTIYKIPIDNCASSTKLDAGFGVRYKIQHDLSLSASAGAKISNSQLAQIRGEILANYGYQNNKFKTINLDFYLAKTVPPYKRYVYIVEVEENWANGVIYDSKSGKKYATYSIRDNVSVVGIIDSREEICQ